MKRSRKLNAEKSLGVMVLSDESDDEGTRGAKGKGTAKAREEIKVDSSSPVKKPDLARSTKPTLPVPTSTTKTFLASSSSSASTPRAQPPASVENEDQEILRLRAEIAALKRQTQLNELRRERDELARKAGAVASTSVTQPPQEKKKRLSMAAEEEEREVAGLLIGGKEKEERKKKKLREDASGTAEAKEWEEMVLSDSSE